MNNFFKIKFDDCCDRYMATAPDGFQRPDPLYYHERGLHTPVHIEEDADFIICTTADIPTVNISKKNLAAYCHDYIFSPSTDQMDMPFSSISVQNDGFDHYTPDVIKNYGNDVLVVEFATTQGSREIAEAYFMRKREKYTPPCSARCQGNRVHLVVIVVCEECIISSLPLTSDFAVELKTRFEQTKVLRAYMDEHNHDYATESETQDGKRVLAVFSQISEPTFATDYTAFSKEVWTNRLNPTSQADNEVLRARIKASVDKVNEKVNKDKKDYKFDGQRPLKIWEEKVRGQAHVATRSDPKNIVNLPLFHVACTHNSNDIPKDLPVCESSLPEGELLAEVVMKYSDGEYDFTEDHVRIQDHALSLDETSEERTYAMKATYHRVRIALTESVKVELAAKGFNAKDYLVNDQVEEYRHTHRQPFSLLTSTCDIDNFLNNSRYLFRTVKSDNTVDMLNDLIETGYSIHDPSLQEFRANVCKFGKHIRSTKFASCMRLITSIAIELSISTRQHCDSDQIIFKRVRGTDCYLIIKPTNSNGPEFFMIAIKRGSDEESLSPMDGHIFRKLHASKDWYFSELLSVRDDKLTNWVKAAPMFVSVYSHCLETFNVDPFKPLRGQVGHESAMKLTSLLMMIFLHDKTRTEEVFTLSRYVLLEGIVCFPVIPKPEDILNDIKDYPMNRLELWAQKKLINECVRMHQIGGYLDDKGINIMIEKLICPWTGDKIQSFDHWVSCFYYGYFTNKETKPNIHTITSLYDKILKEEFDMPKHSNGNIDRRYLGREEPPINHELQNHEYSPAFLKRICDHAKQIKGASYMEDVDKSITIKLARFSLEELGTLKASSNFCKEKEIHNFDKYSRSKAIEKLYEMIKDDTYLVTDLLIPCLNILEENGMYICMFKKPQAGGTREIYVMTFAARLVQSVIECIARAISEKFANETMTHPNAKYTIPDHTAAELVKRHSNKKMISYNLSDDASKWSQRHSGNKLMMMLIHMTPVKYHSFLFRAMRLWETKKLMLDVTILNHFKHMEESGTEFLSHKEIPQLLFKAYKGEIRNKTFPAEHRGTYMQVESGMMQGILHHTSSTLHVMYLQWYHDTYVLPTLKRIHLDHQAVIMDTAAYFLVSSDDSSYSLMFVFKDMNEKVLRTIQFFCAKLFELKTELATYLSIYQSKKKKKAVTPNFIEFNSEFRFKRTLVKPTIKYIASSVSVQECENTVARLEQTYNLMVSVVENGGTFILASLVQQAQAELHYRILGMQVNALFPEACRMIKDLKDPSLGFFPLDEPIACGAGGFTCLLYFNAKASIAYQGRCKTVINGLSPTADYSEEERRLAKEHIETMSVGTISKPCQFSIGERRLWFLFRDKMDDGIKWKEMIEENPEIIFFKPRSGKAIKCRIMAKIHTPAVTESISRINAVPRMINSSVYLLSERVFHKRQPTLESKTHSAVAHEVASLYFFLNNPVPDARLEEQDWKLLFPYYSEYEGLREKLSAFKNSHIVPCNEARVKSRSNIMIFSNDKIKNMAVDQVCAEKWWPTESSNRNKTAKRLIWTQLKETFRWLDESPVETLRLSPFKDFITLRNYLASLTPRSRTLHMTGTSSRTIAGCSNLVSTASKNIWGNFYIPARFDVVSQEDSNKVTKAMHYLTLAANYTPNHDAAEKFAINVLSRVCNFQSRSNPQTQKAALEVFHNFVTQKSNHQETAIAIERYKLGVIGYWKTPQAFNPVERNFQGAGCWIGKIAGCISEIHVNSEINFSYIAYINLRENISHFKMSDFLDCLRLWCESESISVIKPAQFANRTLGPSDPAFGISHQFKPHFGANLTDTTRVYINSNINFRVDVKSHHESFKVKLSERNLRLVHSTVVRGQVAPRDKTVLSISLHSSNICASGSIDVNDASDLTPSIPLSMWVSYKALDVTSSRNRLNGINDVGFPMDWVMIQFKHHIEKQGKLRLISGQRFVEDKVDDFVYVPGEGFEVLGDDFYDLDDLMAGMNDDHAMFAPRNEEEAANAQDLFMDADEFLEMSDPMIMVFSVKHEYDSWASHPFLSAGFNDAFAEISELTLKRAFNQRIIPSGQEGKVWVTLLAKHMDLDVSDFAVDTSRLLQPPIQGLADW